jgi:cytoskeletal protein RodZ
MQESAGLGALLRDCREARGLSLDDLSRATRIAARHLLALEEDRLRDLPAPVFVRGFIRSYCVAVADPPECALARYEAWVAATDPSPLRVPRTVLTAAPGRRRLRGMSLASQLVVAGLLVVIGGAVYLLASSAATRPADAPRRPDETPGSGAILERPPAAAPSAAPLPAVPEPAPAAPAPTTAPAGRAVVAPVLREATAHVLVARTHGPSWVSVQPEDGAASQELLEPGSVREWRSAGRFTVTVGNAGGVTLELDGVALPPLGDRGQVVRDFKIPRESGQ